MDYDGVDSIICDAEESDWLDISYSERNYVAPKKSSKPRVNIRLNKPLRITAIVLLCVALLSALLFIDGQFAKDVFQTAKAAWSATVFDKAQQQPTTVSVALPSNIELVDLTDGVATFEGGRAALSFTAGTVAEVGDGSVRVAIDDATAIVYGGLTDIYVAAGDTVSVNSLLAKYDGTFTASIAVNGNVVDVIGSDTQLTWNV